MGAYSSSDILAGIFVGGRSSRMGGVPKGTLRAPDGTPSLVERLLKVVRASSVADVVLVGQHDVYAQLGVRMLADEPRGIGPLGGLRALLAEARRNTYPRVLAFACDLPYVSERVVRRLIEHAPEAAVVAPYYDGQWQTMCARYATQKVTVYAQQALEHGEHSLQALLAALGSAAQPLPLEPGEQHLLRDWDSPADIDAP